LKEPTNRSHPVTSRIFVADCSPKIHFLAGIYFSNRPDDGGQLLEVANRCQDNVAKQDGASSNFASHFASHFSPKELFWRVFYFTNESLCESLFATRISVVFVFLWK